MHCGHLGATMKASGHVDKGISWGLKAGQEVAEWIERAQGGCFTLHSLILCVSYDLPPWPCPETEHIM